MPNINISFESDDLIVFYEPFIKQYFKTVLNFDYNDCILTNLSSICHIVGHDMTAGSEYQIVRQKTLDQFGVDLETVPEQLFVELFKRLQ